MVPPLVRLETLGEPQAQEPESKLSGPMVRVRGYATSRRFTATKEKHALLDSSIAIAY
jgi:hypothetical protein